MVRTYPLGYPRRGEACMTGHNSDSERFRAAFASHYKPVRAFVLRRTLNEQDADDQTAATFATAWRRVDGMPTNREEQRIWLFAIARKTLSNHYRSERRRRSLQERLSGLSVSVEPSALDSVLRADDMRRAAAALGLMGDADRELIVLSVWDDLSLSQISSILGVAKPVVSVRLHRAKRRLRSEFERLKESHRSGHHLPSRAAGEPAEQEST